MGDFENGIHGYMSDKNRHTHYQGGFNLFFLEEAPLLYDNAPNIL